MPRRPIFDHKLRLKFPDNTGTGGASSSSGLPQPYTVGQYYPESFTGQSSTTEKLTAGTLSITNIGPLFCGGTRRWDRIGMFVRWASSPGTAPDYRFVVYALRSTDLFPTAIIYTGAVRQPGAVTPTWEEDTIALTTTSTWIGVGWHWNNPVLTETIAVRAGAAYVTTVAVDTHQGYVPYGMSRSGDTLTPHNSLYATQAAATATPAPATSFVTTIPAGVVSGFLGSGVQMRRA